MFIDCLIVGASGFVGSIVRYLVYVIVNPRNPYIPFPLATLLINILGCFLIGIIGALIERAVPFHRHLFLAGSVGFLGAFTTFSAFGAETATLLREQQFALALLNILGNTLLGLLAVWMGRKLVGIL